jgi:hypothetical protein
MRGSGRPVGRRWNDYGSYAASQGGKCRRRAREKQHNRAAPGSSGPSNRQTHVESERPSLSMHELPLDYSTLTFTSELIQQQYVPT